MTHDIKVGDRVRLTGKNWEADFGKGFASFPRTITEIHGGYPYFDAGAYGKCAILKSGSVDYSVTRVDEDAEEACHDNPYYVFPNGVEVRQISQYLTSFGGQSLQYIARATRLDGNNKGDVLGDLKKARDFIDWEIARVEEETA